MRKIITVDGTGGVGKGTLCLALARKLNWLYLDSGALYRLLGLYAQEQGKTNITEVEAAELVSQLKVEFVLSGDDYQIKLNGKQCGEQLRTETCAVQASKFAAMPEVRAALLSFQRNFGGDQPLVADGRDMGTVIFPNAELKIFLTADVQIRAERRYKQLKEKGQAANLARLKSEIAERDERDSNREIAPLKPASDAVIIDTGNLSIEDVQQQVFEIVSARFLSSI